MGKVKGMEKKKAKSSSGTPKTRLTASCNPVIRPGASSGSSRKSTNDEHVHMYVQPYCRNGSIHNSTFLNGKLLLVKMQCDRRPNAMFKINRWAQVYFEGGNDKMVASFDDFQEMFHCMYAWTGANVTVDNGVRFPKNLTGFFVSADSLKDWLMEMDEMMHWRTSYANEEFEKLPTAPSLRVHLPQDMQITLSIDDDLKCDIAIANEEP